MEDTKIIIDPDYNTERRCYYGLRKGDIVKSDRYQIQKAEVVDYGFMDNNRVVVQEEGEGQREVVAEWMTIITKVEDR